MNNLTPDEESGDTNCSMVQNQVPPEDANVSKALNEKPPEEKPGLNEEVAGTQQARRVCPSPRWVLHAGPMARGRQRPESGLISGLWLVVSPGLVRDLISGQRRQFSSPPGA